MAAMPVTAPRATEALSHCPRGFKRGARKRKQAVAGAIEFSANEIYFAMPVTPVSPIPWLAIHSLRAANMLVSLLPRVWELAQPRRGTRSVKRDVEPRAQRAGNDLGRPCHERLLRGCTSSSSPLRGAAP